MKNFIQTTQKTINTLLVNFTLAKFAGAFVTIILVALIKYIISGNFHIEYCEFWNNVAIGLLSWTINTTTIGWFSDYLGVKGINFNLNQFLYGYDTMGAGASYPSKDFKAKLYNAMESEDGYEPSKQIDKGNGINKSSNKIIDLKKDVEYYQLQTLYYMDVLKTFNKPKIYWTKDEWALVTEQVQMGDYNLSKIQECLKENRGNLSKSINDLKEAKGISDASTLGKHYSASLTENYTTRAFKND